MWNKLFSRKITTSRKGKILLFSSSKVNWICLFIEFIMSRIWVRLRSSDFQHFQNTLLFKNIKYLNIHLKKRIKLLKNWFQEWMCIAKMHSDYFFSSVLLYSYNILNSKMVMTSPYFVMSSSRWHGDHMIS